MNTVDRELQKKIPIRVSVERLERDYPWLANLQWNMKEEDKNGKESE